LYFLFVCFGDKVFLLLPGWQHAPSHLARSIIIYLI
jgi:hypothetical protein